jgi:MFS family permease
VPVQRLAAYLRSLNPDLPRPVWLLQMGGLANWLGQGIAYPFLVIYLHNVRGFSLDTAGLVLASSAAIGLVSFPVAGAIVDRVGGRVTLAGALVVQAVGYALFPLVHEPWEAFGVAAVVGAGVGGFWPGQSTLLAGLMPEERRHAAYSVQRITMNLGFGLGGLTGGLIASTENATTFTVLFLVNAATCLVFASVLIGIPEPILDHAEEEAHGGYRAVLRDRTLLWILVLNALFVSAGYAQLELLPAFAKNETQISEAGIGLIFFINTLSVVLAQLPVMRLLEGRRRMLAYVALGLVWAVGWLGVLAAGVWFTAAAAVAVIGAATIAIGLGECIHGVVHAPLVIDLAPPRQRGRYIALSGTSWSVGFIVGPAVGGFILDAAPLALWPAAAGASIVGGLLALRIEGRIPRPVRRTPFAKLAPAEV